MSKRATIDDVARMAGVSKSTVSAVLNGSGAISESTRSRVSGIIEQLNYRPSSHARRRSVRQNRSIGLMIRESDNPFYSRVIDGIRSVAWPKGYTVLVVSSEGSYDAERKAVRLLQEQGVDGLLLYPVLTRDVDLSHLFELKRQNFPFILLESIWGLQASLVDVDNVAASRKVHEYLLSLGHRRIVHFAGPAYSMHGKERVDGVYRAFSESHFVVPENAIVPVGSHLDDGYRVGLEYFGSLEPESRPTAVTCFNDMVAIGLCRALKELGLVVPGDVSVIGFDDVAILEYLPTPLTSVRMPRFETGKQAAELLIRHIESGEILKPQTVRFDAELVVRDSTRPLDAPRSIGSIRASAKR